MAAVPYWMTIKLKLSAFLASLGPVTILVGTYDMYKGVQTVWDPQGVGQGPLGGGKLDKIFAFQILTVDSIGLDESSLLIWASLDDF